LDCVPILPAVPDVLTEELEQDERDVDIAERRSKIESALFFLFIGVIYRKIR